MSEAELALAGHAIHSLTLRVGHSGPWVADVTLTKAPTLPEKVTLKVGDALLQGSMLEAQVFGLALSARIVGGGGGWSKTLKKRGYHNDAGIKASLLAEDAAREVGETLGTFAPSADRVGVDYARRVAVASSVLEYAAGDVPWWVDYAGVTHAGLRVGGAVSPKACSVLGYDPLTRVVTLAVDHFAELVPGRTLSAETLPESIVVGDIELTSIKGQPLRATVWARAATAPAATRGRLGGLLEGIVSRLTDARLDGVYRYRVMATRGDLRVDLQAIRAAEGLPDLQAVPQCPGIPGLAANLTDGAEVLVMFVDGDRADPIITHYAGPGARGFAPVGIILGDESGMPAARQGDSVEVLLPQAIFTGTVNMLPATGVVQWVLPKADGQITGGSGKVRIA